MLPCPQGLSAEIDGRREEGRRGKEGEEGEEKVGEEHVKMNDNGFNSNLEDNAMCSTSTQ